MSDADRPSPMQVATAFGGDVIATTYVAYLLSLGMRPLGRVPRGGNACAVLEAAPGIAAVVNMGEHEVGEPTFYWREPSGRVQRLRVKTTTLSAVALARERAIDPVALGSFEEVAALIAQGLEEEAPLHHPAVAWVAGAVFVVFVGGLAIYALG